MGGVSTRAAFLTLADVSHNVVVSDVPVWVLHGILLGLVATLGVFVAFVIGMRYFDTGPSARSSPDPNELRRLEVRAYLAAIGEPALENIHLDGIAVDFWLPRRDVAITFDAETYFELLETDSHPVLVEHEVPGDQIGPRLPFETPPLVDRGDPPPRANWARSCLEVDPGADRATIEAAYRERVLEAHPDRGGSTDELSEVLRAYEHLTETVESPERTRA